MEAFEQIGERRVADGVASVVYLSAHWRVTVERVLAAPTGGPTRLVLEATAGQSERDPLGGWDGAGIQQVDLRAIPIDHARRELEQAWIDDRAADVIRGIPEPFVGEHAFARLAEAVVTLRGWNVANPTALIARHLPGEHRLWNTRVKRARDRGYLTTGEPVGLTAKSLALLKG